MKNLYDITAIVMAYNEEDRIEYTLKSLKDFPEIIVVDKESTDNTVEIARQYGAKIISVKNYDDIFPHPAGYETLGLPEADELAQNEWLLMVLCSEVLHKDLYIELKQLINTSGFEKYNRVNIPNKEYILGYTGFYIPTAYKPHRAMMRKGTTLYQDKVHNELNTLGEQYTMNCQTDVAIYHMSYIGLSHSYKQQIRRYAMSEPKQYEPLNENVLKNLLKNINNTKRNHLKAIILGYIRTPEKMGKHAFVISLWRNDVYKHTILLYMVKLLWKIDVTGFLDAIQKYIDCSTSKNNREVVAEKKKLLDTFYMKKVSRLDKYILNNILSKYVKEIKYCVRWEKKLDKPISEKYDQMKQLIINGEEIENELGSKYVCGIKFY